MFYNVIEGSVCTNLIYNLEDFGTVRIVLGRPLPVKDLDAEIVFLSHLE